MCGLSWRVILVASRRRSGPLWEVGIDVRYKDLDSRGYPSCFVQVGHLSLISIGEIIHGVHFVVRVFASMNRTGLRVQFSDAALAH